MSLGFRVWVLGLSRFRVSGFRVSDAVARQAKELQELKKKKGSWKLAGQAITELNLCVKDCILSIGKATWKFHAGRARDIKSPVQVLSHNVACASSKFWALELEEILESSLYDSQMLQHVLPRFQGHEKALQIQVELFEKLFETRASSLIAFHSLPPLCYNHALAAEEGIATEARKLALNHWQCLLEAEAAEARGAVVGPLDVIHWRHSALIRILFMAFEEDRRLSSSGPGQAGELLMVLSKHLGDSRLVEMAHQQAKDLFRSNKNVAFSNTTIMSKILTSQVLENRGLAVVKANVSDKVTACTKRDQMFSVVGLMKASTHKLPKSMQELMVPERNQKNGHPLRLLHCLTLLLPRPGSCIIGRRKIQAPGRRL